MHMGAGSLMAQHLLLAYPGEQRSLRHNPDDDDDDVPLHQHTQTTLQAQSTLTTVLSSQEELEDNKEAKKIQLPTSHLIL